MTWYLPVSFKSGKESDPVPWAEDNSSESVNYVLAGHEVEMLSSSEEDKVQIREPPPIPLVNLVTEEEDDDENVEDPKMDEEKLEPMDVSVDTEGELEVLASLTELPYHLRNPMN
jgi:hypothetical protein